MANMKRELACIFLFAMFLLVTSQTNLVARKVSFDGCQNESWKLTDVSMESVGDKVIINTDIAYGEGISQVIHKSVIELSGCDQLLRCTNVSRVSVKDINCNNKTDLTEHDAEACDIALLIGEWETQTGDFSKRFADSEENFDGDLCIVYESEDIEPDGLRTDEVTANEALVNDGKRLQPRNAIVALASSFILYLVLCH